MTNPPPVKPVEGHYALLRGDAVVGPIRNASVWHANSTDKWGCWYTDFLWDDAGYQTGKPSDSDLDIIATISPEAMKLAANPELICDLIKDAFDTSPEYKSLKGAVEKMLAENDRLRAALQNIRALAAKRQHEGGPDGNLKTIEEFAVYGLEGKNP